MASHDYDVSTPAMADQPDLDLVDIALCEAVEGKSSWSPSPSATLTHTQVESSTESDGDRHVDECQKWA